MRNPRRVVVTPCVGVWIETRRECSICKRPSHTLRGCVDWNRYRTATNSRICAVTPCVGVWIETVKTEQQSSKEMSHPAWVCGLKPKGEESFYHCRSHTLRGCVDWNIQIHGTRYIRHKVTPCVGVWIETRPRMQVFGKKCHTLRGCVDWNKAGFPESVTKVMSHPAWVCGLKQRVRILC